MKIEFSGTMEADDSGEDGVINLAWRLMGPISDGGIPLLPYTLNFVTSPDGALPAPWAGATWAIASGVAKNTPTEGANGISNPEFTSDTTGWASNAGATLTRRDYTSSPNIAPTGGIDNFGMEVANTGTASANGRQSPNVVAGMWYKAAVRAYAPSANATVNAARLTFIGINSGITAEDTWQTLTHIVLSTSTGAATLGLYCVGSTSGDLAHYDAASIKPLSGIIAYRDFEAANIIVKAAWTITTGYHAGVVARVSADGTQYLLAYHDGVRAYLFKILAAGSTQLLGVVTAYAAGANVEIRCSGNTIQLFYNNVQVGADQAEATLSANTRHGLFSTIVSNTVTSFSAVAN